MATRHHQRQLEEQFDDGYEWGSHRGGGGAPLRGADGRPISKLGTVLSGNIKVDGDKYNSLHNNDSMSAARPKTSYHTSTQNISNLFDPIPTGHVPITPIRQRKSHSTQERIATSHMNDVIAHNSPKSNRVRVTNIIQEHHRHQDPPNHLSHHEHHGDFEAANNEHVVNNIHSGCHVKNGDNIATTADNPQPNTLLLRELNELKTITRKQIMLQSFRWALGNLDLVENSLCIGNRKGDETNQIYLSDILKEIIFDLLKGRSHNIGTRRPVNPSNLHKATTEETFLVMVSESLHLLCGVEPTISRRADGDFDVFIGLSHY